MSDLSNSYASPKQLQAHDMRQTKATQVPATPTTQRGLLDDLDKASKIPRSVVVQAYPVDPVLQYVIAPVFDHYYTVLLAVATLVIASTMLCPLRYKADTCSGAIWDLSFIWLPLSIGLMHSYTYMLKWSLQRSRVAT